YPIQCRKKGSLDASEEILLDLNTMGQKFVGLGAMTVSDDGSLLAYSLDTTGFRDYTLYIKDLRTGALLPEQMQKVKSVAWAKDGKTLFYATDDASKRPSKLWRHALGSDTAKDTLIYEEKDEMFTVRIERTRSDAFLLLDLASHTQTEVRFLSA